MANLVELSNELEFVPKEQLIQMSQDPNSTYPSYLVLSEIQRRTQMEKMYAAQQPKPETTVSDELVAEFAGSPSGLGAMAQSSDTPNAFQSGEMGNMAPPSPLMAAASGGLINYAEGSKTKFPLLEAKSKVTKEQNKQILNKIAEARLEKFGIAGKMSNLGDRAFSIMGGSGNNIRLNPTEEKLYIQLANQIIEKKANGGLTGYQAGGTTEQEMLKNQFLQSAGIGGGIESTLNNPMKEQITEEQKGFLKKRYTKPDGSIDFGRAALDGFNTATLAMILAPEPTTTVVGGALRGIAGVSKGLFNLVRNPKQTIDKGLSSLGRLKSRITEGKRFNNPIASPQSTSNLPVPASKFRDMGLEVVKDVTPRAIGAGIIIPQLLPDKIKTTETETETAEERAARLEAEAAAKRETDIAARQKAAEEIENQRLAKAKESRQVDMLIGLGGAIGSARNLGELSSGISDAYFGVKSAEQASELKGLQGRLLEAQAAKYEADVANMPLDAVLTSLSTAQKQLKYLEDSGDTESAKELILYIDALNERAAQLQGITIAQKNQRNELLGLVEELG